jgi:AraC-like ligand binding domain
MVMAFNPDDPHDGRPCDDLGFTDRMVHIGPELVTAILAGLAGRSAGRPLFADPVISDPGLAARLIAQGMPLSEAAAQAGFADQSHLTRWFSAISVSRPAAISAPCSEPGCSRLSPVGRCRRWSVPSGIADVDDPDDDPDQDRNGPAAASTQHHPGRHEAEKHRPQPEDDHFP